jgi:putative ABC transport system permease protein
VSFVAIRGRYLETLGTRLLRGRELTDADGLPGRETAMVNQRFATMFLPNQDPIGRRICLTPVGATTPTPPACVTIVGVSPTIRQQYLQEIDPVVYVADRADAATLTVMVRGESTGAAARPIRTIIASLDPTIGLNTIEPLEHLMTMSRWGHRVFGGMLSIFALVGLVLAGIGLYAVTASSVVERTQEIGIRMALGARPSTVIWLFIRRAGVPVGYGMAVGLAGALTLGRLLQRFLIGTGPADPATLASITVLSCAVAVAACFLPARRAARLDPLNALRYE